MDYLLICAVALFASGLTFFSGFGLGTLLLPAFAVFFPIDQAIALTAVVHLLNNIFKLTLTGKHADKSIVWKFGLPAIAAAFAGAYCLTLLSGVAPVAEYPFLGKLCRVTPVNLTVGVLIAVFAVLEAAPRFAKLSFDRKYLPLGGIASGFFGGLSGHQGALRSAFLMKCNLTKEAFIATGVVIACLIDVTRLGAYAGHFSSVDFGDALPLLGAAALAAFAGAYIGNKLLKKATLHGIQIVVSVMLVIIAVLIGAGIV